MKYFNSLFLNVLSFFIILIMGCTDIQSNDNKEKTPSTFNENTSQKSLPNKSSSIENDSVSKIKIEGIYENLESSCAACETLTSVKFFIEETNVLIDEFDVIKNNPYNHFDLPILKITEGETKFDLKNLPDWRSLEKYAKNLREDQRTKASTTYNYSNFYKFEHNQYTVITYIFSLASGYGGFEGLMSLNSTLVTTFFVLNNHGEIVSIIEDQPAVANDVLVTSDGRYLTYNYSDNNFGFRIHDLNQNKILLDYPLGGGGSAFTPNEKIIVFGGYGGTKRFKMAYFHIPDKTVYLDEFEIASSIFSVIENSVWCTLKDGSKNLKPFEKFQQKIKL